MKFDLNIPPAALIRISDLSVKFPFANLHCDSYVRHSFYKNVLEPAGHAKTAYGLNRNDIIVTALSHEYVYEIQNNPQFLQALVLLTL